MSKTKLELGIRSTWSWVHSVWLAPYSCAAGAVCEVCFLAVCWRPQLKWQDRAYYSGQILHALVEAATVFPSCSIYSVLRQQWAGGRSTSHEVTEQSPWKNKGSRGGSPDGGVACKGPGA